MARQAIYRRVNDAIKAMDWLEETDEGAKRLALSYAILLDSAITRYEEEEISVTEFHKLLRLGPDLLAALTSLGGTPATRRSIKGDVQKVVNGVDEIKAKRAAKRAARG